MLQPSHSSSVIAEDRCLLCVQAVVMNVSTANSGLCGHLTELSPKKKPWLTIFIQTIAASTPHMAPYTLRS